MLCRKLEIIAIKQLSIFFGTFAKCVHFYLKRIFKQNGFDMLKIVFGLIYIKPSKISS